MSDGNAAPSIQRNLFQQQNWVLSVVSLLAIMVVGWNYWLPTAEDYFNLQTKSNLPPNVDFLAYYTAGWRFESGANPYYWANTDPEAQDFAEYLYPPTFLPSIFVSHGLGIKAQDCSGSGFMRSAISWLSLCCFSR